MDRRKFLVSTIGTAAVGAVNPLWLTACATRDTLVNDRHSQLNETRVGEIVAPRSVEELAAFVRSMKRSESFAIAGGRHAMGGQQFARQAHLVDMRELNGVLSLDRERGVVEVEAGIQWPQLIGWLHEHQPEMAQPWSIIQKQTGADRLSIGGSLSANAHGRGLQFKPMVDDVESLTLLTPQGELLECSRSANAELFRLAIGGYGLFGTIATVRLRLMPRTRLERTVELIDVDELAGKVRQHLAKGFLYGDGQFAIDPESPDFLRRCVFSSYRPVPAGTKNNDEQKRLNENDWRRLLLLTHTDKTAAFEAYANYYLSTSGQTYWSDTHQLSTYIDDYHALLDQKAGAASKGTEMISEVYVSREHLPALMEKLREDFRKHQTNVIYGTVRFIERDDVTFLPWARESFACIVFNFHVSHTGAEIEKAKRDCQRLIDRALDLGGNYFLTYHRWARPDQVEAAYPQFRDFLRLKRKHDPEEQLQSEWYRHYREMFQI